MSEFKATKTLEERVKERQLIEGKYNDRIPVIIEKQKNSKLQGLVNSKILVPYQMTVAEFSTLIRSKLKLQQQQALNLLVGGKNMISQDNEMVYIYEKFKDEEDGFLYIVYTDLDAFG